MIFIIIIIENLTNQFKMSVSNSSNPNIKTSICKYAFIGCKQQQKCWYAHNKEELRQRYCINGVNCDDKNCCYLHPNKNIDKDEYYLRILLKSDVLGIDKNNIKKQIEIINSKIVIEIDNDNYDDEYDDEGPAPWAERSDSSQLEHSANRILDENIDTVKETLTFNEDDNKLKQYIEEFTEQYKINPEQFYDKVDNKNEITLKIKTDDLQFQILTHFMKTMNIEFNIESFTKNQ